MSRWTAVAAVLGIAGLAGAGTVVLRRHTAEIRERRMELVGRKLLLRYESGLEVAGHYTTASELTWEALNGPAQGATGTEAVNMAEVAPGIFFVSWLEEGGTTVSQVLDLERMVVTAFITFDTPNGRRSTLDRGTLADRP